MNVEYANDFKVIDSDCKAPATGTLHVVTLRRPHSYEEECKIIRFRKQFLKIRAYAMDEQKNKTLFHEGQFLCAKAGPREYKSGDLIELVLTTQYNNDIDLLFTKNKIKNIYVEMERITKDMFDGVSPDEFEEEDGQPELGLETE